MNTLHVSLIICISIAASATVIYLIPPIIVHSLYRDTLQNVAGQICNILKGRQHFEVEINLAKPRAPRILFWCFHTRGRRRLDNDKTNVEPVHSYDAFHTRSDKPGVKGIIEMHRFNICLVVVLSLSCSGVKTPFVYILIDFLN